jgi:hypothetical protein
MDESGGLHGGDDWWRKIVAEITAREVFLVVLSPQALASEWVLKEMGIAYFQYVKAGKKLRPILLEACTLTTDWELIHAINFSGGPAAYAAKLEELLGTLDLESGAKAPPPAAQRRPAVARLVQEVQVAFGLQDWRAVEDKTDALAQLAPDAFTAALWQERGLALLALDNPELALEHYRSHKTSATQVAARGLRPRSRRRPTPSPAPGTAQPAERVSWRHAPRGACIRRRLGTTR